MEILELYKWNIFVGIIISIVMGIYGSHIVSREKTLETLTIGQVSTVGILLGVIIKAMLHIEELHSHGPELATSIVLAVGTYIIANKVLKKAPHLKTPFYISLYLVFIALNFVIISLSPLIESHLSRSYFGDIVTLTDNELIICAVVSIVAYIVFMVKHHDFLNDSFEISIYGDITQSKKKTNVLIFNLMSLALILTSIFTMGLIYTIGLLVLPGTLLNLSRRFRLKEFYLAIVLLVNLSVVSGFLLNLKFDDIPTSPLILLCILVWGIIISLTKRLSRSY